MHPRTLAAARARYLLAEVLYQSQEPLDTTALCVRTSLCPRAVRNHLAWLISKGRARRVDYRHWTADSPQGAFDAAAWT